MVDLEILIEALEQTITNLLVPAFQFYVMYVLYTIGKISFVIKNKPQETKKRSFVLGVLVFSFIMGYLSYENDITSDGYYDGYHYVEEIEEVKALSHAEKLQKSYSTFFFMSFLLLLGGYKGNKEKIEIGE